MVVRIESYLGSQIAFSGMSAICLISLRPFWTVLLDWLNLIVTPAWTRTLVTTDSSDQHLQTNSTGRLYVPTSGPTRRPEMPQANPVYRARFHELRSCTSSLTKIAEK